MARKNQHIKFCEQCAPCLRTLDGVLAGNVQVTIVSSDKVERSEWISKDVALANFGDCRVLVLDQFGDRKYKRDCKSVLFLADGDWWRSIYGE